MRCLNASFLHVKFHVVSRKMIRLRVSIECTASVGRVASLGDREKRETARESRTARQNQDIEKFPAVSIDPAR